MALAWQRSATAGTACSRPSRTTLRVVASSTAPGSKVEKWLKTPFDMLSFGPRAAVGALISLPERLQMLSTDVEKVQELLQDPRPLEEKQQVVMQEVEDTLVEFLERGANVEADVLSNVKSALPAELAEQLEGLIPPAPNAQAPAYDVHLNEQQQWGAPAQEVATPVYSAEAVVETQMSSELSEIRNAVSAVKAALEELRSDTDPSRAAMLRLNLREARGMLARRLQEVAPVASGASGSSSLAAATREARVLLNEIDAQFFGGTGAF